MTRRPGLHEKSNTTLVLVGQAPGKHPSYKPHYALFPLPARSTGAKLCEKLGLMRGEYIGLERHNVLDFYPGALPGGGDHFPSGMGKESALQLSRQLIGKHVIMVGATTAKSFGFTNEHKPFVWYCAKAYNRVFIPHLSGMNRWWNDAANDQVGSQWLYEVGLAWKESGGMFRIPTSQEVVFD